MILDNLSRALKTQNWLAAGVEFVIVISGVVIGFQINAWAEGRADAERETLLLARLQADFTDLAERSGQAVAQCEAFRNNALALSRLLAEAPDQDRDTLVAAVTAAIGTPVPVGRSATYVEMLASGEMALVRSEALRAALVDFDEQVRRHELAYESLSILTTDNAGIILETATLAASPSRERLSQALDDRLMSAELAAAGQLMGVVNARNCFWFNGVRSRAEAVAATLSETR
jgi:hypothetical protein